jgi:hypothetical protein
LGCQLSYPCVQDCRQNVHYQLPLLLLQLVVALKEPLACPLLLLPLLLLLLQV